MRLSEYTANVFGYIAQRWRWWHVSIVLTAMFLAACGLVWLFQSSELEERYAEMRAAGHPVTLEELNDYYALPARVEDNTELWLEAVRLIEASSSDIDWFSLPVFGDGADVPPSGEPWAERELVVGYLNDYAEALVAIHKAVAGGGNVRFPRDYREGYGASLNETMPLRECARLLVLEGVLRAYDSDLAGSVDSLRSIFTVGRTFGNDPLVVSFLVRVAVDGMAVEYAKQLFSTTEFPREDLTAFQADLRELDYTQGLRRAVVGDRAFTMSMFDDLPMWEFDSDYPPFSRILAGSAKVRYLDLMRDVVAATEKPWPEALSASVAAGNWQPNPMSLVDGLVEEFDSSFISVCVQVGARATANTRSLDAAIAVELFRRDHGDWPAALNDLVPQYLPAVPVDPFDGKPLRYIVKEPGFVVYSVGEDLVDDQGDVDSGNNNAPLDTDIRWGELLPEVAE